MLIFRAKMSSPKVDSDLTPMFKLLVSKVAFCRFLRSSNQFTSMQSSSDSAEAVTFLYWADIVYLCETAKWCGKVRVHG